MVPVALPVRDFISACGGLEEHWVEDKVSRGRIEGARSMERRPWRIVLTSDDRDGCQVGRLALLKGDSYGLDRRRFD